MQLKHKYKKKKSFFQIEKRSKRVLFEDETEIVSVNMLLQVKGCLDFMGKN